MVGNIKVGQEVCLKSTFVYFNSCIVTEVCDSDFKGYVKLNCTRDTLGSVGVKIKDCYPTKKALFDALQAEYDKKVRGCCDSIQTVEDLVRFCYNHNFSAEEYTD